MSLPTLVLALMVGVTMGALGYVVRVNPQMKSIDVNRAVAKVVPRAPRASQASAAVSSGPIVLNNGRPGAEVDIKSNLVAGRVMDHPPWRAAAPGSVSGVKRPVLDGHRKITARRHPPAVPPGCQDGASSRNGGRDLESFLNPGEASPHFHESRRQPVTRSRSPLSRSEQMSRIRGKDTSPERRLRSALWSAGLRYRVLYRTASGVADVAFPRQKVAVFVDGCFWHGCPDHYVLPRSRQAFWVGKLRTNVERDIAQTRTLERQGWRVIRLWEHQIFTGPEACVAQVVAVVAGEPQTAAGEWRVVHAVPLVGNDEGWTMVSLREGSEDRYVVRPRRTTKWKRPSGGGA